MDISLSLSCLALHSLGCLAKVSLLRKSPPTILSPKDIFLCPIVTNHAVSTNILLSSIFWLMCVSWMLWLLEGREPLRSVHPE